MKKELHFPSSQLYLPTSIGSTKMLNGMWGSHSCWFAPSMYDKCKWNVNKIFIGKKYMDHIIYWWEVTSCYISTFFAGLNVNELFKQLMYFNRKKPIHNSIIILNCTLRVNHNLSKNKLVYRSFKQKPSLPKCIVWFARCLMI